MEVPLQQAKETCGVPFRVDPFRGNGGHGAAYRRHLKERVGAGRGNTKEDVEKARLLFALAARTSTSFFCNSFSQPICILSWL